MFNWLETLDVYIQPRLQEGVPRAMIEALSCGFSCIGAKTAGIPELIDNEFIYSQKKNPAVIAKLIPKMRNKEQMLVQAKKNFDKSNNIFSVHFLYMAKKS